MSEYGCITNTRTFAETAALYQADMTSAFSGGLVYEYAEEGNGYGIVTINGNTVTPISQQFSDLQSELAKTQDPTGDGGYSANNAPQDCPGQSENWDTKPFTGSALPACPSGALIYFKKGPGKAPGLNGPGSQDASGGSSATASANAGTVTHSYGSGSSPSSSSAATSLHGMYSELAPVAMCSIVVLVSIVLGASIL